MKKPALGWFFYFLWGKSGKYLTWGGEMIYTKGRNKKREQRRYFMGRTMVESLDTVKRKLQFRR